ncbi:MAG: putative lipid II flippase FtsW [Clostridia bacterium]|nr:putative lipid II flippase FtsW [Clostridia bacterium]
MKGKALFKKSSYKEKRSGDKLLLFSVVLLSLIGLVFVYSASSYSSESTYGNKFYVAEKHLAGLLLGYVLMMFSANFDYQRYKKTGIWALIIAVVLLALCFTPIGVENYGAKRWIKVGPVTVQPSEIAKICYIIFSTSYFASDPGRTKTFKGVLPIVAAGAAICGLIISEPNMSITMCFGMLMLALLFASGAKFRHFAIILVPIILFVPVLIIAEPYRLNRLSAFLNPWASPKGEGYQLLQSLYALGSGGLFGVGLFNSRQKFKFLPFSESDFILAVIGEEVGFFGLVVLFLLIAFIFYRGIRIAARAKSAFGYLAAVGITSVFIIQSFINALVVTGSIPPTGLPLPLVSAGNTSLSVFLFSFGALYNISRDCSR